MQDIKPGQVDPLFSLAKAWEEPGDLNAVQNRIVRAALEAFRADVCTLFLLNPITGDWAAAGTFLHTDSSSLEKLRLHGLEFEPLFVEDLDLQPSSKSPFSEQEGIRAFAAVALGAPPRPKPFAVLYIDYRQPQRFGDDYRERLSSFSTQASSLLQNAWLFNRYCKVIRIGEEINEELDTVENLFRRLDKQISDLLDTSYFFMLTVFNQNDTMEIYSRGQGERKFHAGSPISPLVRWVIEQRQSLHIRRYSAEASQFPFALADFEKSDPKRPESLIFVPLMVRAVPMGVLSVQSPKADAYDDEDRHILELLANHVAAALNNIHLFVDLDQLSTAGQLLAEQLDSEQVVQSVVDRIVEATQADLAILYPYHQETHNFDLPPRVAGQFVRPEFPQPSVCRPGDIPHLTVAREETLFLVEAASYVGLAASEWRRSIFQERERIRSVAAMPLHVGGETVGALFLNYRHPQTFKASQRRLIQGLAVFAAIAIKNARKFGHKSARRERELAVLERIASELPHIYSLSRVLLTLLERASEIVGAERGSILLIDQKTECLRIVAAIGWQPVETEGQGLVRWSFENRQTIHVGDVQTDPVWKDIYVEEHPDNLSELDVPLQDGERVFGAISLTSPRQNAFTAEDVQFITTLAGQAVLAIKRAQTYEVLERRLQALQGLSKEIVRQPEDPDIVMRDIVTRAVQLTEAVAANLDLYERDSLVRTYSCKAVRGSELPQTERVDLIGEMLSNLPRSIMKYVALNKQPYRTAGDAHTDSLYRGDVTIHSELAVPLIGDDGELVGVLNVESPELYAFKDSDQELLSLFADQAVIAIQNARSHERAGKELARFQALLTVGQKLSEINEPHQRSTACEIVAEEAAEQCRCHASIRAYDAATQELVLVRKAGLLNYQLFERMKVDEGLNGEVFRTRKTVAVTDTQKEPAPKLSDPRTRSLLVTPVQLRDIYFGNLALAHSSPDHFGEAEKEMAEGLARLLATTLHRLDAIERQRDLQELAKQSEVMSWIGEASYSLAHRLGNDLGLIPTYVSRVRKTMSDGGFSNPKVDENLSRIHDAVRHVLDLSIKLRQEVATFRLQDPQARLIPAATLLEATLEVFRDLGPQITLTVEPVDPGLMVRVLPDQIQDILLNLVRNAIEALEPLPNGGSVTLRARGDGHEVRFQVTDTGPGVPPEASEKIFQFLYSSKGSSGFGLWSAQRKAWANGGRLEVESALGQGTTFTLTLPQADRSFEAQFGDHGIP